MLSLSDSSHMKLGCYELFKLCVAELLEDLKLC